MNAQLRSGREREKWNSRKYSLEGKGCLLERGPKVSSISHKESAKRTSTWEAYCADATISFVASGTGQHLEMAKYRKKAGIGGGLSGGGRRGLGWFWEPDFGFEVFYSGVGGQCHGWRKKLKGRRERLSTPQ